MAIKIRPYKGTNKWEVDIVVELPDGSKVRERKRAPVTSKSGAQRWAEAREREILLNGLKPKKRVAAPTLSDFQKRYLDDYCRAQRQKESTIQLKESILRTWLVPHLGNKPLNEIDNAEITRLKKLLKDTSPKHANNVLTTLNTLLQVAVDPFQVLEMLPCKIELFKVAPKERAFFEFEDFEALVEAAGKIDARTQLVILLGGEAGLRIGETIALEQSDIDYRRGIITVSRAEYRGVVSTPKGGRGRKVPMTRRLAAALKAHRHLKGDRILVGTEEQPITYRYVGGWLRSAERRAGLPVTGNTHKLRHTFCSHLAMRGAPARAIQELAGHVDLKTTLNYMHLSPTSTRSAIDLLEPRGETLEKRRDDFLTG